ncbi:histidine phosphatase family protein, partial [Halomonas sp. BC04]|uniref:histidine phosphatase family protein n=1 Tax=Halomonas sp. BC04 TaxID=1403540 RepID=UPI001E2FA02B
MSNGFLNASTQRRNRYLLMRHGHSQANARGLIISTPERGLTAFGLSPQGVSQLDALLADWHWPTPTRILHSDFLRTTETAARVASHFALPLQREPRLRERHFGDLEGLADDRYPHIWRWMHAAPNTSNMTWRASPASRPDASGDRGTGAHAERGNGAPVS